MQCYVWLIVCAVISPSLYLTASLSTASYNRLLLWILGHALHISLYIHHEGEITLRLSACSAELILRWDQPSDESVFCKHFSKFSTGTVAFFTGIFPSQFNCSHYRCKSLSAEETPLAMPEDHNTQTLYYVLYCIQWDGCFARVW